MTRSELMAHHEAQRRLNEARELYRNMKLRAFPGAQNIDAMPRAQTDTKSKVEELAIVLADLSDQIDELRAQVMETQPAVIEYIHSIEEPRTRMIISLRVLCGLVWERVAYILSMSQDAVRWNYRKEVEKLR